MKTNIAVLTLATACVPLVFLAGCSRGPMPPTEEHFERLSAIMMQALSGVTAKEGEEARANDEKQKAFVRKTFVEPFRKAGYDLDATLMDYAVRARDGEATEVEGGVIVAVLMMYSEQLPSLARWGFIKEDTKELVTSVLDQ